MGALQRRLQALIEPHYPKAGLKGGRPPMPLETILRIYFLQNWYALSDPMAEPLPINSSGRCSADRADQGRDWRFPLEINLPAASTQL